MKKVLFLLLVVLNCSLYGQNIESLGEGIKTAQLPKNYQTKLIYKVTDLKTVTNCSDSIVFEYFIEDGHKDILVVVYLDGALNLSKCISINDKKGFIIIDKSKLLPGNYSVRLLSAGENRSSASITVTKDLNQKQQIGNYIIYWKDNKYLWRYTGTE